MKRKIATLLKNGLSPQLYAWMRRVYCAYRSQPPGRQRIKHLANTILGTSRIIPWSAEGVATSSSSPLVSIVIPTRDHADLLDRAVETLFEKSAWPNKELIVVDNGSVEPKTLVLFERIR